jgi:hypothetical protein
MSQKAKSSETFVLIADKEAAEQRAAIAHSASYGFGYPQISEAPAGAGENCPTTNPFLSPRPGLEQISNPSPRLTPWATFARHSVASGLRSFFGRHMTFYKCRPLKTGKLMVFWGLAQNRARFDGRFGT